MVTAQQIISDFINDDKPGDPLIRLRESIHRALADASEQGRATALVNFDGSRGLYTLVVSRLEVDRCRHRPEELVQYLYNQILDLQSRRTDWNSTPGRVSMR